MKRISVILCALLLSACHEQASFDWQQRDTRTPGFVGVEGTGFAIDGEEWFPLMINYKTESNLEPARYYGGGSFLDHFLDVERMGFNAVRVCVDILDNPTDTAHIFRQLQRILDAADSAHLRVMALIKTPFSEEQQGLTRALLRRFSASPTLWAYDFFNEPLYFDPNPQRSKEEAFAIVKEWQAMMNECAPHQLFTIGFSEPIEVFEWDPSLLPVDFVEVHTYHPMRVANEMYWYARFVGRPWMVGETALPADNKTIAYEAQTAFLQQSFQLALDLGACGYGWWEYADCPEGVNFEAQYAGLRDTAGRWKPAAYAVSNLKRTRGDFPHVAPCNFYNMLLYKNIQQTIHIHDAETGEPIQGAVLRGWNEDWSVGINTFSDETGTATLWSNDVCVHWEVSAPGYSHKQFNRSLPFKGNEPKGKLTNQEREYQGIPLLESLCDTLFFRYDETLAHVASQVHFVAEMPSVVELRRL